MTEINELIGKLDGQLIGISASLQKIDKALFGNGQPGAMERITRIEENLEKLTEDNNVQTQSIDKLSASVSTLKSLMESHVNDSEKHNVIRQVITNKQVALFFAAGFIILHYIYEELPAFWVFITKLLGI